MDTPIEPNKQSIFVDQYNHPPFPLWKKISIVVGGVLVLSIVTCVVGYFYLNSRISMAEDGLVTGSCGKQVPTRTTPVIFVPDMRASALTEDGHSVWLGTVQALFSSAKIDRSKQLVQAGLVRGLPRILGVAGVGSYDELLSHVSCQGPTYVFAYNWNADFMSIYQEFQKFVYGVAKQDTQVTFVSHGTGGLLVHYMLHSGDAQVKIGKVVYAGVPFQPGLAYLQEMRTGVKFGRNAEELSSKNLSLTPLYYQLLPHKGQKLFRNFDLFDPYYWKAYNLPALTTNALTESGLEKQLDDADKVNQTLDSQVILGNHFMLITGNCTDTLYSENPDGSQNVEKGDGLVPLKSALPLELKDIRSTVVKTCQAHHTLYDDSEVVSKVLDFITSNK